MKTKQALVKRIDPYERVTNRILEHLDNGTVPWHRPWDAHVGAPANMTSGRTYQGINIFLLGMECRPSPWWMTYRQAIERGGQVRKGERGTRIVKVGVIKPKKEESELTVGSKRQFLREYTVFNACQIYGIEFPEMPQREPLPQEKRIEKAESLLSTMPSPLKLVEGKGIKACYSPYTDRVSLPAFGRFESPEAFYGTLYHELIHSTGHQSRLARTSLLSLNTFGDHEYSKEELVAEMGAAMLLAEVGIVTDDHKESANYLASWMKVLNVKEHRRWIVEAASQASKAADFILGRTREPFTA